MPCSRISFSNIKATIGGQTYSSDNTVTQRIGYMLGMPGESVSKIVTVKNTGEADAYIRVWVNTAISEPGDPITNPLIKNLPLTIEVDGETVELIDIDYNTEDWTAGEDGYWYYGKALKAGETTEPLFENVTFHKLMGNAYQNSRTIVDVSAEATQVANNGTSAMTAAGWPET